MESQIAERLTFLRSCSAASAFRWTVATPLILFRNGLLRLQICKVSQSHFCNASLQRICLWRNISQFKFGELYWLKSLLRCHLLLTNCVVLVKVEFGDQSCAAGGLQSERRAAPSAASFGLGAD